MSGEPPADRAWGIRLLGIGDPDYVRSWRTWFRWRIACMQHHLTFRSIWDYQAHWKAQHSRPAAVRDD